MRSHLDDVLIVRLVGELLVVTLRIDHDARTIALPGRIKACDRRAEVGGVVAPHQVLRQLRAAKVDHDLIADLPQVDRMARGAETAALAAAVPVDATAGVIV